MLANDERDVSAAVLATWSARALLADWSARVLSAERRPRAARPPRPEGASSADVASREQRQSGVPVDRTERAGLWKARERE